MPVACFSVVNNPDVCVPRAILVRGEPSARWDRREARWVVTLKRIWMLLERATMKISEDLVFLVTFDQTKGQAQAQR